ncbi:MAG: nucleotide sugar dehydrogenase [Saprospiraceae bacterium]|nr:nucleotide sugar dehydrogenase [Saprospiraceae bacterium]
MLEQLLNRQEKLAVIGLGYVGLPIALEFAKKMDVVGFDINQERVDLMNNGVDPSKELDASAFENKSIQFTANPEDLRDVSFYVVAVPTPINKFNTPNLNALLSATRTVGNVLSKGDYVVYESTVYPGCTEEDCLPILEELSGLKLNEDFKLGFSPERINPGDKKHTLTKITKVVSGSDEASLKVISDVYASIIEAGVHEASSIKVAEAAKIIENTQRDVNIALMNELSVIFNKMDIPTYEVLEAAGTKWNFLNFYPGLVGGHCIGVDPYYLTYKASSIGYNPEVILSGRRINDSMPEYVAKEVVKSLIEKDKPLKNARILVKGITFKENVADIRNSKAAELVLALQEYFKQVDVVDLHADAEEVKHEYGIELGEESGKYDVIIFAVSHEQYNSITPNQLHEFATDDVLLFDLKNIFKGNFNGIPCWTL